MAATEPIIIKWHLEIYGATTNGKRYRRLRATLPPSQAKVLMESARGVWERKGDVVLLYPKL